MNFSIFLSGVLFFVLHDICLAKVFVKYSVKDEIESVYAARKANDRHLGHLATLTLEERLSACSFHRPGKYIDNEESKPHMYRVNIPESVIPKKESGEEGSSKAAKPESPKPTDKGKAVMETDSPVEEKMEKMKMEKEEEKPESKKEEEKTEPDVIYNEEIGFRCQTEDPTDEDFIISYGFAQEMYFVSKPVGELDKNKDFSGREMQLEGYMYAPPISEVLTEEQLHQKYYDLRERTEKARGESEALLTDIETHDDISALLFAEKNIFCASLMDSDHYTKEGYQFVPAEDPKQYEYVKREVKFPYQSMSRTFMTDFIQCRATKGNSPAIIGATRSYAEGGDVFTAVIDEKADKQFIDTELVKIPVLYNRKYAGDRPGVLEVLNAIRAK